MKKNSRFSRYHVAKMMEMRYGLKWSYRRISRFTNTSPSGVRRAIIAAESGKEFPEVSPFYFPVCPQREVKT